MRKKSSSFVKAQAYRATGDRKYIDRAALLKYQEKDGMWRQIIDDPEAWKEKSGTAMFTYTMITGCGQ